MHMQIVQIACPEKDMHSWETATAFGRLKMRRHWPKRASFALFNAFNQREIVIVDKTAVRDRTHRNQFRDMCFKEKNQHVN